MSHVDYNSGRQTSCRRCGVCCQKGGPCLHLEDRDLIEEGKIPLSDLFTIRPGEPVWDNVSNRVGCASEDIIRIRSKAGTNICLYFNPQSRSCAIYRLRPHECRILKCWDTDEIKAGYDKRRLSRRDLLTNRPELWELITAHQEICNYDKIGHLARDKDKAALAYLIRYELAYRDLVIEKGGLKFEVLDFLFGSALKMTIRRYGISI